MYLTERVDYAIHSILDCDVAEVKYGKSCPYDMASCLNNNKAYDRLETAWKDCGKVSGCDFVMKYHNNKYYLRRTSDPNVQNFPKVRGYIYNQCRE